MCIRSPCFRGALTFRTELTLGNSLVTIKNYAYFRIALTFGLRLVSELYGTSLVILGNVLIK